MNVWAIDAGNTAIKLQFFADEEPGDRLFVLRRTCDEEPEKARAALADAGREYGPAEAVVIGCGRYEDKMFLSEFAQLLAPEIVPRFLSADDPLPFKIQYTSGRPGPDRLANIMALRTLFPGQPALAVDFGTATNIVVVNAAGDFAGGVISPGPRIQGESLVAATAGRLPAVTLAGVMHVTPLARSTEGAIQGGILLGIAGAVERIVRDIENQFPGVELQKVATGGWAETLLPHTHSNLIWHAGLTLFGLRCFAG